MTTLSQPLALHPSTVLALQALQWLQPKITPEAVLEIGCGNGILSLAAHHLWHAQVLACDISERAVTDAQANIAAYGMQDAIRVLRSDGLKHPGIASHSPYDLVIANLLAQWQVEMAMDMVACLRPGGTIILSGIMLWQNQGVLEAFSCLNINILQSFTTNEWQCDILRHIDKTGL